MNDGRVIGHACGGTVVIVISIYIWFVWVYRCRSGFRNTNGRFEVFFGPRFAHFAV
jgi:hypothetical protein